MEYTKQDNYKLQSYLTFVPVFGLIAVMVMSFINVKKISLKWAIIDCFLMILTIALLFMFCGMMIWLIFDSLVPNQITLSVILSCLLIYMTFILAGISIISIEKKINS